MKRDHKRRIDRIEASLLPQEIVCKWFDELESFDSMGEYLNFALADWSCRGPIARLLDQAHSGFDEAGGEEMPPGFLYNVSGLKFLQTVLWEANLMADETLGRCRSLLETATAVIDLVDLLWHPIRAEERVAKHLTFESDDVQPTDCSPQTVEAQTVMAHISKAHAAIAEVLSELRAFRLAAKRVSELHFWGMEILFWAVVRALEEANEAACHCAERYDRLLDRVVQRRVDVSQESSESGKVNFRELEEVACHKAEAATANLIDYADTMMRLAFGEQAQQLSELEPVLGTAPHHEIQSQDLEAAERPQSLRELVGLLTEPNCGADDASKGPETADK
jgi:hypothetical protein